ncbi:MAG: glycoside hydrolase family 16 protein [Candidatus Peregrinibacteria bacterium]|nr:glycoside hydrolase family 16 protein [Candidatus Peregrinibacteria bacterium]
MKKIISLFLAASLCINSGAVIAQAYEFTPVESTGGFASISMDPLPGYPTQPMGSSFTDRLSKSKINEKLFEVSQDKDNFQTTYQASNTSIQKGKLELSNSLSSNGMVTAGEVVTQKYYLYGTFTIKAKANQVPGMVSSISLYNETSDEYENIDMEMSTLNSQMVSISNSHGDNGDNAQLQNDHHRSDMVKTASNKKMNTYKIEWLPGMIRWYVNGKKIAEQVEAVPTTPLKLYISTYHTTNWTDFVDANVTATGSFSVDSIQYAPDAKEKKISLTTKVMKVKGDAECQSNVDGALNQLRDKPWYYNFVVDYIDLIECVETGSVMWVWETPRRHTAGRPTRDDPVQFADDLIHEACHSHEYTDYHDANPNKDVPEDVYSGHDAEEKCLNYQTEYLRRIGEKDRADGYKDAMATEWWKVDTKDMKY